MLGSERELTARFVAHLAELEERRLHKFDGIAIPPLHDALREALRLATAGPRPASHASANLERSTRIPG